MAGIYQIKNLINNKFYIGSTYNKLIKRKGEHISSLKHNKHKNKHLQSAWNKYGEENFEFTMVEEMMFPKYYDKKLIKDHLLCREAYYIEILKPDYNLAKEIRGGLIGRVLSKKERKKIGDRCRGRKLSEETINKIKVARARQVITDEHKEKIRKAMTGKKFPGRTISNERKLKAKINTQYFADNHLALHSQEAKQKRTKTLKKVFNTPEMKAKLSALARSRNKRPFLCFNKQKEFIGEFLSQANTADILGLKSSEICAVLRKEQSTTKGYTFIYKDLYNEQLDR